MTLPKKKYEVYLVGTGHGCFNKNYSRHLMGETWAVSKKKAVSNIHYRIHKSGEELPGTLEDSYGMGYVVYTLEAEEV